MAIEWQVFTSHDYHAIILYRRLLLQTSDRAVDLSLQRHVQHPTPGSTGKMWEDVKPGALAHAAPTARTITTHTKYDSANMGSRVPRAG
jgi:hypothetical protein